MFSCAQILSLVGRERSDILLTLQTVSLLSYPLDVCQWPRERLLIELEKMLKEDSIEPSASPWAANILVKKKDGSVRFCVDYRKLNECTKKDG